MAVGSKSKSQQQVLGSKIRQKIAQELVVQSEKNIDLLLGILAFIGWYGVIYLKIEKSDTYDALLGLTANSIPNLSYPSSLSLRSLWSSILGLISPFLQLPR
jgi:hypothetical protein